MSGITIFAGVLLFYCKVPFANALYVSVPPPAVIAVKAVCSEVNLPVPTAWFNKTACKVAAGRILLLHLENLLQ
jgi:hypothetical protein